MRKSYTPPQARGNELHHSFTAPNLDAIRNAVMPLAVPPASTHSNSVPGTPPESPTPHVPHPMPPLVTTAQIQALQQKIQSLEKELQEKADDFEEVRHAVDQWQAYSKKVEGEKEAAEKKIKEQDATILELSVQISKMKDKYEGPGKLPQVVHSSVMSLKEFYQQVEGEMAQVQVDLAELRQQLGRRDDVIFALREDLRTAKERIHWFETELTLHRHRAVGDMNKPTTTPSSAIWSQQNTQQQQQQQQSNNHHSNNLNNYTFPPQSQQQPMTPNAASHTYLMSPI
eukprot:PhF_6_TR22308/c0_g1_i1/m.31571